VVFPYQLSAAGKAAVVTLAGTVRGHDVAETLEALWTDPAWQYGIDTVWDGTNITELLFEKDDLPGLVRLQGRLAARCGPGRDIVVAIRPIDRIMAQIYGVLSKGLPRTGHLARSVSEAWEMLASNAPGTYPPAGDVPTSV
jgi:hypothetical protein